MSDALAYLKLTDKLACQGPQSVYAVLRPGDLESASDVRAVEDQESFSFSFFRLDETGSVRAIAAQLRAGRVITVMFDDGEFDEWRVGVVTTGRGLKGIISVQCVPLWLDLVERADSTGGKGWVSDVAGSTRNFDYEFTERTPAQIWADGVIPNSPSFVGAGDIDPSYVIKSLSASRLTPGALALAVRDAERNVDVPCEVQLRRNGTTDYKLDIVTQIGANAPTPVFHPSNGLLTLIQKSDPTLQATRILMKGASTPDGLPGEWGIARWRGGAPSGNVIALTDRNGGASPIAFDNQFVGTAWLYRVKTGRTFLITASSAAAGTVTLSSVSTIAADEDFEFRFTEPLTNTRTTTLRYAVSAVPDGTHITLAVSAPIAADSQYVDWYARVWSASSGGSVIATTRISGSVAATDAIAVASSAGVTTAHFVEFIQLDGAGEVPSYVDHPLYSAPDPVGYGIKVMELSRPALGVTDIVPNAWERAWSNPSNPPDGWSLVAHAGTGALSGATSQNTNPAFTRYGGKSWAFTWVTTVNQNNIFITPPTYPNWDAGHTMLSARMFVYFTVYVDGGAAAPTYSEFRVHALTATGAVGASLGGRTIMPAGSSQTQPVVGTGAWVDLEMRITIDRTTAPYGVVGLFDLRADGGSANQAHMSGYLDAIEMFSFGACPNDAVEFGDATALLQAGNNRLREVATPPLYYSFDVLDLARAFPSEYPRLALTMGGTVRAPDVDYGIDATVRLLRRERNLLNAAQTRLTLGNRSAMLTKIVSAAAATQQRVIAAVVAGSGAASASAPAFVALAAATTLTQGAEISTVAASAPVVTLPTPAAPTETGVSVTYVPADPTTTPTTRVTVGTPPSRKKIITPY